MQRSRWIVGRSPDCDIVLTGAEVSARHCCLTRTERGFTLEDLGSSNGTFVNGERVSGVVAVGPSDRVVLGKAIPLPWPAPVAADPPRPAAGSRVLTVGRSPDNDVVLDHPTVSARHARLAVRDGRAEMEDLGSVNGTHFGGRPIPPKIALSRDDVVYFGALRVPVARLMAVAASAASVRQLAVVGFSGDAIVFGRHPSCEQVLDYPMISSRHARLSRVADGFRLEDLGSTNGTFVNGKRLSRPVPVRPGDVIGLGSFAFTLTERGDLQKRDFRGNATLEARGLTVAAAGRTLIQGIDLTILPGEFVGLMGPSGAGKTTLMNALNGYSPPAEGSVRINGQDLYRHYDQFRPVLGYVPQDDVVHRELTVRQALSCTARLRLPPDHSEEDIRSRVEAVLAQLNLRGAADVLIGSPERKGISGGERRRVSLAMELLTDPLVLYLDEPTSGLSSQDALAVMKVLRGLADQGKTILLTIHQPGLEVYRLMDHLVLMGKDAGSAEPGRLVYFGPAYPDAVHHFNPDGVPGLRPGQEPPPEAVLAGLASRSTEEWAARFEQSELRRQFARGRKDAMPPDAPGSGAGQTAPAAPVRQWLTLVRRMVLIKSKDRTNTGITMAQAPVVAALIVLAFGKQMAAPATGDAWPEAAQALGTSLFLMALGAAWLGASNAAREIVGEWAVFHRERMVNLRLGPYVASKYAVLGVLCLGQCSVLLGAVWAFCGLKAPLTVFALLILTALVGTTVGLLLSAVARTSEAAISLLPVVLLPMVILGGTIQPTHKMGAIPRAASYLVPTRWAFEGMILAESGPRPRLSVPAMRPGDVPAEKDMAESFFPAAKHRHSLGAAVAWLVAMIVAGAGGLVAVLRSRDVH